MKRFLGLIIFLFPIFCFGQGAVPLGEVVYFDAITFDPTTGAPSLADSTPTFNVYEEATDTAIVNGTSMTARTGHTGEYRGTFTASTGNGFEQGKWYVTKSYATVGGLAGITISMHFRVMGTEATDGVIETNVKNINNVSTSSVSVVAANVGTTQPINFTGTGATAYVKDDVTDWKAATAPAMTGDAFARLGAPAGASVSADVAAAKVDTAAIKVKTDFLPSATAGAAGGVFIAGTNAATGITGALTTHFLGTLDTVTTWTGATPPTGDTYARLGAPVGASHSADVAAVKADTAAIKAKTDSLTFTVAGQVDTNLRYIISQALSAKVGTNFNLFYQNAGGDTAKVVDDVGGGGAGATDWTSTELAQIRKRLGIDGTALSPAATPDLALASTALAVKAKTDSLTFTVAGQADSNVIDWKGATAPAMTGDAYARVGAPAGASLAADTAAIKAKADQTETETTSLLAQIPWSVHRAVAFKWPMKFVLLADGVTAVSGQTPTCTRSIDSPSSFGSTSNSASVTTALGWSEITISSTDMTGNDYMILRCTAGGSAGPYETTFKIQTP